MGDVPKSLQLLFWIGVVGIWDVSAAEKGGHGVVVIPIMGWVTDLH
jgi:hypothetical protein